MLEAFQVLSTTLGSAARAVFATLAGVGQTGDDAHAEQLPAEMMQPHGFAARPVVRASLEAVGVRVGDEVRALYFVDKGGTFAVALEAGEARVYAESGAIVRLRASGDVEVTPAAGRSVVLAGGALNVARATDAVAVGAAMATWMAAVSTATGAPPLVGTTLGAVTGGNAAIKG